MNRQGHVPDHGTLSRYSGTTGVPACRCRACTARAVREDTLRHLDRLAGKPRHVPASPSQDHLLRLQQRGLSYMQISRACGVHPTSLGEIARGKRHRISRKAETAILAVPIDWVDTIGNVPAIGAVRRVRALYAIGVSRLTLVAETGFSKDSINHLASGRWEAIDVRRMIVVRAAYDRLWRSPGSSVKNRYRAQRESWPGPLHWNDESIDDPDGFPDWTGACGTPQGYKRHGRDVTLPPPCEPCKRARVAAGESVNAVLAA